YSVLEISEVIKSFVNMESSFDMQIRNRFGNQNLCSRRNNFVIGNFRSKPIGCKEHFFRSNGKIFECQFDSISQILKRQNLLLVKNQNIVFINFFEKVLHHTPCVNLTLNRIENHLFCTFSESENIRFYTKN